MKFAVLLKPEINFLTKQLMSIQNYQKIQMKTHFDKIESRRSHAENVFVKMPTS